MWSFWNSNKNSYCFLHTYCVFSTIWSSLHTVAHLILVTDIIIILILWIRKYSHKEVKCTQGHIGCWLKSKLLTQRYNTVYLEHWENGLLGAILFSKPQSSKMMGLGLTSIGSICLIPLAFSCPLLSCLVASFPSPVVSCCFIPGFLHTSQSQVKSQSNGHLPFCICLLTAFCSRREDKIRCLKKQTENRAGKEDNSWVFFRYLLICVWCFCALFLKAVISEIIRP